MTAGGLDTCQKNFCQCYDYTCSCGAPYKYDEHSYHWAEKGEPCAECDKPMPDLSCQSNNNNNNNQLTKDMNDLSNFTNQDLQDELKRRAEEAERLFNETRRKQADFWLENIDALITLVPEHSRTSCSDSNISNEYRCTRCFLLCAKESNSWDYDRQLTLYVGT